MLPDKLGLESAYDQYVANGNRGLKVSNHVFYDTFDCGANIAVRIEPDDLFLEQMILLLQEFEHILGHQFIYKPDQLHVSLVRNMKSELIRNNITVECYVDIILKLLQKYRTSIEYRSMGSISTLLGSGIIHILYADDRRINFINDLRDNLGIIPGKKVIDQRIDGFQEFVRMHLVKFKNRLNDNQIDYITSLSHKGFGLRRPKCVKIYDTTSVLGGELNKSILLKKFDI